jgi:hypothetical protein
VLHVLELRKQHGLRLASTYDPGDMGGDSLALCRRDLEMPQMSWELSLWRDGQVQRYEVYWDAGQGRAAFAERAVAST